MKQSELRKGYGFVEKWIREGMPDAPSAPFTEGDLRLAAELCVFAVERMTKICWATLCHKSADKSFPKDYRFCPYCATPLCNNEE